MCYKKTDYLKNTILQTCIFFRNILQLNRFTWKAPSSLFSAISYFSFFSIMSLASCGSFLSMCSIGSVTSIFSTGSVASIFSVGCIGKFYTDCTGDIDVKSSEIDIPVKIILYFSIIFAIHIFLTSDVYWIQIPKNNRLDALKIAYAFTSIIYIVSVILLLTSSFIFDGGAILVALSVCLSHFSNPLRSWFFYISVKAMCLFGTAQMLVGAYWTGQYLFIATLSTFCICSCIFMHISFLDLNISLEQDEHLSLRFSWVLAIVVAATFFIASFSFLALWNYDEPGIGTFLAGPLNQYGVGPEKRWIVFNLTHDPVYDKEGLNKWSNLRSDDKKFAKLRVYGSDSLLDYEKYVGIERKGQNWRSVPNLNFAMIKNSFKNKILNGKKDDAYLYEALGDEYEDYWVSFGARGDITHTRQIFAAKVERAPNVLVEVLTELNGVYYYEGIGFLTPAHQRKFYNNVFGFSGKVKCNKDGTFDDRTGPYLLALNTPPKVSLVSDLSKREDSEEKWKYVYPKKDNIEDECNANNILNVSNTYDIMVALLESDSLDSESLDLSSFIRTRVYDNILQDTDFPYRSQEYVYYNNRLYTGILWDFNSISHMYNDPKGSLDLINVYATYGYNEPMGLWKTFCSKQSEIFNNNTNIFFNALNISGLSIKYVETLLSENNTLEAFGRAEKRSKLYGTQQGNGLDISTDWRKKYVLEPDYPRERDVQILRIKDRIKTIEELKSEDCQLIEKHRGKITMVFFGITLIVWCFIIISCGCDFFK